MKYIFTALSIILILAGFIFAEDLHFETDTDKIIVDNNNKMILPLKMITGEHQHLNREPEIGFALIDTACALIYTGFRVENDTKSDESYFSGDEIFQLFFKFTGATRPDSCVVKGEISYVHCSETEGWCKRSVQPVEVTIYLDGVRR
ncbi:MAG: hypothetical protein AB7W47_10725 [Calditrichaceae bacterium]